MGVPEEDFSHLYQVIATDEFLKREALGGEIPFFIYSYLPEVQNSVEKSTTLLKRKLANEGIPVLELDLYALTISLLEQELSLEEIFELERDLDKEEFKEALQSILDIHEVLMPEIARQIDAMPEAKVYFLTGIGKVFPFIRSHNILNNLQNVAKDAPTLAFFPGKFNGRSLELFGLMKDDNYYRAFDITQLFPKS